MKQKLNLLIKINTLILCLFTALSAVAVPGEINHQGRIFASDGTPLGGAVDVTFTLYSHSTNNSQLWSEQLTVVFDDGYYSVNLNSGDVYNGADVWLGITLDGIPEFEPRTPLTSVPYAFRAKIAEKAGNPSASDDIAIKSYVDSAYTAGTGLVLVSGEFAATLGDSIDSSEIEDNAVDLNHLGMCSNGESLQRTDSGWECVPPGTLGFLETCDTPGTLRWNDAVEVCTDSGWAEIASQQSGQPGLSNSNSVRERITTLREAESSGRSVSNIFEGRVDAFANQVGIDPLSSSGQEHSPDNARPGAGQYVVLEQSMLSYDGGIIPQNESNWGVNVHGWWWPATSPGGRIVFDMGNAVIVDSMGMFYDSPTSHMDAAAFAVEYSDDDSNWSSTGATISANQDRNAWNDVDVPYSGAHRYWSFLVTSPALGGSGGWDRLRISSGSSTTPDAGYYAPVTGGTDITVEQSMLSHNSGIIPTNENSWGAAPSAWWWPSTSAGGRVVFDLGSSVNIASMGMNYGSPCGDMTPVEFTVEYSDDGSSWTGTGANFPPNQPAREWTDVSIPNSGAHQYWSFLVTEPAGGGCGGWDETRLTTREITSIELVSKVATTSSAPDGGSLLVVYEPLEEVNPANDIQASLSRDGGDTFVDGTMQDLGVYDEEMRLGTMEVSFTDHPSGTDMVWRLSTDKDVRFHGVVYTWE